MGVLYDYSDFTEANYKELVILAKSKYEFSSFVNRPEYPHVLWRHDVDFSMHRSLRLAEIENEADVSSTYFLHPHSPFYNLLCQTIVEKIFKIVEYGHNIGLHFDPTFYGKVSTKIDFMNKVQFEKDMLKNIIGIEPSAISFHNYGVIEHTSFYDDEVICGMINAYSKKLRAEYDYVSDSNGIWRFRRLREVLEETGKNKLHVLTHPGWWTPTPLSPRARIQRCIDGYAAAIGKEYDQTLETSNRPNIR